MTNESELNALLFNELKLKRQELDAAKLVERKTAERLAQWKKRAREAEAERQELRVVLEKNVATTDTESPSKDYKQRAIDAEAALTKYKQKASNAKSANKKTLEEFQRLEQELAQAQKLGDDAGSDIKKMGSKLAQYRQRVKDAKAAQKTAEDNYQRLRTETAEVTRDLGCQEVLKQQCQTIETEGGIYSQVERATDEQISRALDYLPLVEGHPAANLKPIGDDLTKTFDKLSQRTKTSLKYSREYHSYTENQVIFTDSLQHGYMLRPRTFVKYNEKNEAIWFSGNTFHMMVEPFEAFYQRDGLWYYIGTYRAFYICEAPWETFKRWTNQSVAILVRATINGSRNIKFDIQHFNQVYERYACDQIMAGYIGIQCVGFNHNLYHELQQALEATSRSKMGHKRGLASVRDNVGEAVGSTNHKRRRIDGSDMNSRTGSFKGQPIVIRPPF